MASPDSEMSPHTHIYEKEVHPDGSTTVHFGVHASNEPEAKEYGEVLKKVGEELGIKVNFNPTKNRGSKRVFGPGGSNWTAGWKPIGPKPNWGPPKDQRAN